MDTTTYIQEVAKSVRTHMECEGESILSLSKKTLIPYTTLQRRVSGDHPFTIRDLAVIANTFDTTPDAFLPKVSSAANAAAA